MIYKRLIDSKFMSGENNPDQDGLDKFIQNRLSLRMTTESTLHLLQETNFQSFRLFYFLGCFPIGISKECLNSIWPSKLEKDMQLLETMNLLDLNNN